MSDGNDVTPEKKRPGCLAKVASLIGALLLMVAIYAVFSGPSLSSTSYDNEVPDPPFYTIVPDTSKAVPDKVLDKGFTQIHVGEPFKKGGVTIELLSIECAYKKYVTAEYVRPFRLDRKQESKLIR